MGSVHSVPLRQSQVDVHAVDQDQPEQNSPAPISGPARERFKDQPSSLTGFESRPKHFRESSLPNVPYDQQAR